MPNQPKRDPSVGLFEAAAAWLEATADYDGPWSIREIAQALRSVEA